MQLLKLIFQAFPGMIFVLKLRYGEISAIAVGHALSNFRISGRIAISDIILNSAKLQKVVQTITINFSREAILFSILTVFSEYLCMDGKSVVYFINVPHLPHM